MSIYEKLANLILNFTACTFLVSLIFLWLRRRQGDRARYFLIFTCLYGTLSFFVPITLSYTAAPMPVSVLCAYNLIGGLFYLILFHLYPIEVISPGWLTPKRTVMLFMPWVLLVVAWIALPMTIRELHSFGEIIQYIGEPNVWFRVLILLTILPYNIMIFVVPHNWMRSSVSNRWIYFYSTVIICIGIVYDIFTLTGLIIVLPVHLTLFLIFCILIVYQELFIRIPVPAGNQPRAVATIPEWTPVLNIFSQKQKGTKNHPVWIELNKIMTNDALWRDPNLTQDSLSAKLCISRSSLATVIRESGFSGYKEYLNRCRIEDALKIINSDRTVSIYQAFFTVGYRSRRTAKQYFQEYVGCTPAEYMNWLEKSRNEV
ncbi:MULTISPECIES: helix-turn-helix domain-containing protein [Bacteroides]|uniref:helix-turn-helix transcriptional regulator n=1 Tax=Bacteroides TaxID=816 RepID=UPI000E4468DF|nr:MULTISPECIES: helix-turn-helix domain-containing protein [Bacteroides]MBS7573630.1 helix-turn-helix domain-containing protein [Bacteroides propionicigenes]RGM28548.1 helix-turn-helix domain-containing protein [Bacteroides sp. OM08-17BH]HBO07774.1 hypothetical protein [Bacteroides sp.]